MQLTSFIDSSDCVTKGTQSKTKGTAASTVAVLHQLLHCFSTGRERQVQGASERTVRAAQKGRGQVRGEGSAGRGAAKTSGKYPGGEWHPQRQDGSRGGGTCAAQSPARGRP